MVLSLTLQAHMFVVISCTYTCMILPDFNSDRARDTRNKSLVISVITARTRLLRFPLLERGTLFGLEITHVFSTISYLHLYDFAGVQLRQSTRYETRKFCVFRNFRPVRAVPYVHFFCFSEHVTMACYTLSSHKHTLL